MNLFEVEQQLEQLLPRDAFLSEMSLGTFCLLLGQYGCLQSSIRLAELKAVGDRDIDDEYPSLRKSPMICAPPQGRAKSSWDRQK